LIVRPEQEGDRPAIAELNRVAFGGTFEAELIESLREDRRVELSLVAIIGGNLVGHVLFSDIDVEIDGRKVKALSLAPMAVFPPRQRQGIGTRLLEESLTRLRNGRYEAVIVLGHEDYYPRFGFSPELVRNFSAPFSGDAFMALELKPDALAGEAGTIVYPPAFFAAGEGGGEDPA